MCTRGRCRKNDRQWLRAAVKLVGRMDSEGALCVVPSLRGMRPPTKDARTPRGLQKRLKTTQGAPYKCPELREMLWDWFVDIRFSVKSTLSPKAVLMKARELAKVILQEQRKLNVIRPLPDLVGEGARGWLLRFKRDFGIVFRRPNLRYKCSRMMLHDRLRAMYLNVFRVRALAEKFLKNDLAHRIHGLDEKPLHFNESGSKGQRTLEIAGVPAVALKENHDHTRKRLTLMTTVTSDSSVATAQEMHVELLFKGKTRKVIQDLKPTEGLRMSFAFGEKGSYRSDTVRRFLERMLPPWSEERRRAQDYRILMLDIAGSHCKTEVTDFAWERGFIPLFHYGCTTGVAQVNDTDLHGHFERIYQMYEQENFTNKQLVDPRDISRTAQEVVDDTGCAWLALDHGLAVRGHWSTGLSVALDGSEDEWINREARLCWDAMGMGTLRDEAVAEVRRLCEEGALHGMQDWKNRRAPQELGSGPVRQGRVRA